MAQSAYIHIPFCRSKCAYCSFISYPKLELKRDYVKALNKEILKNYRGETLNTLYFGGGTPSLLEVSEFESIINIFNLADDIELTSELNPESVDYTYLRALRDIGINRVSFGVQTFNDEILKIIGRRHNSQQAQEAVKFALDAGFENISIDFIYGLPLQTGKMFLEDLARGVNLGVKHISLYGLSIEKGCYFASNPPQDLPDDDMQADMYLAAVEFLQNCGFTHYEFSNFSYKGFESRHNLNYWNCGEYYGFGVSAHGYIDGVRYSNNEQIESYINSPFERIIERVETAEDMLEEEIFLGFRMMEGINKGKINSKFGIDFDEKYRDILNKYEKLKLIKRTQEGYALTPDGVLLSNTILSEFISEK